MAIQHQHDDQADDDLIINVVPELRRRIKLAATQSNLSVQEYVERLLEQAVPPETIPLQRTGRLSRVAVDKLLQTREAIRRAHPGQVFEDSSDLIHEAREERTRELEHSMKIADIGRLTHGYGMR